MFLLTIIFLEQLQSQRRILIFGSSDFFKMLGNLKNHSKNTIKFLSHFSSSTKLNSPSNLGRALIVCESPLGQVKLEEVTEVLCMLHNIMTLGHK